ncbi:MAG: NAD(P)(+) transhydrogenase (Re/Si-specific) subunit beta [Planctomycetaceae bacterium]|nr:NAD(P)(+) transhydrogenase (Re/Si-specific) subunit beta [Planctomycetaceae bacterium]
MSSAWLNLAYLTASMLFIVAFKQMAHPRTAVRGNVLGAAGMAIAMIAAFFEYPLVFSRATEGHGGTVAIVLALALGSAIGALIAVKAPMTSMPQMVALLNGFGGAASLLVAGAELQIAVGRASRPDAYGQMIIATAATGIIGAVTFWGSLAAFAKLQEYEQFKKPWAFAGRQAAAGGLALLTLLLAWWLVASPGAWYAYWLLVIVASALGVLLTMPIGGADMPVVICLLNSYSGIAAAASGFVIDNNVLVIAGSLVGASGIILCQIMCKAMNRSLTNVLFGGLGSEAAAGPSADDVYAGKVKSAGPDEIAMLFDSARRVVIVPGYGLAVAQAQHAVRDMANLLQSKGIEVLYAIHPVAGRMPGHMNVLLAEANVPYDLMREMDDINPLFPETDVAIVLGANDVVNPVARTDPKSPIAGMPILNVDQARSVVVVKRSLSPGFAGIPNPLFAADNTQMYFADGKKAVLDLIAAIKAA